MIKRLFLFLVMLLIPAQAYALHVVSKEAHIDLNTTKVATIEGVVSIETAAKFIMDMDYEGLTPGDQLVMINSPGGLQAPGDLMIARLELQKALGSRIVCVVKKEASSMAFNLLTHCDVRLATRDSTLLFHKLADVLPPGDRDIKSRYTPKHLRELAQELEKDDEAYRQANAKALNMPLNQYDYYCEQDIEWTASQMLSRGYLNGFATVQK